MTGYLGFTARPIPRSPCNIATVKKDSWWEEVDPGRSRRTEARRVKVTEVDRFRATIQGYVFRDGAWVRQGRTSRVRVATFADSSRVYRPLPDEETPDACS